MTISDNDFDQFVADPAAATQRWAAPVVDQRVGQLQAQVNQIKTQTVRDRVMATLDADPELAGKWRLVNETPEFIAWCQEPDPLIGQPKLDILRGAFDAGNAQRVAAFFLAWLRRRTSAAARGAPGPFDANARQPSIRADATGRRMYSRADIAKFYADKRNGLYEGREVEALRIERDIVAAAAAGGRISDPPPRMPNDPT